MDPDRLRMVEEQLRRRGIRDERVLAAMAEVPREAFLPPENRSEAYADRPIPIAAGQTISQPYVVAAMLEAAKIQPADRVLEIGTGSGYQTALLARLAAEVVSIERHAVLADSAREVLRCLGFNNVQVLVADGTEGHAAGAPYQAIIVSAAAPHLPAPLLAQVAEGGRIVIPVGDAYTQQLQVVEKAGGEAVIRRLELVRFVPLIGAQGFRSGPGSE